MNYLQLKKQLDDLSLNVVIDGFGGFEESINLESFKTLFTMVDAPYYTLLQCCDNDDMHTTSDTWFLCIPKDEKMYVIDAGTEEEMCDQFFNLVELLRHGFGTAEIRPKIVED